MADHLFGKDTAVILCDEWAARMNYAYDWWQTMDGEMTREELKAECMVGYTATQAFIDLEADPSNSSDLKERIQKVKNVLT